MLSDRSSARLQVEFDETHFSAPYLLFQFLRGVSGTLDLYGSVRRARSIEVTQALCFSAALAGDNSRRGEKRAIFNESN